MYYIDTTCSPDEFQNINWLWKNTERIFGERHESPKKNKTITISFVKDHTQDLAIIPPLRIDK